MSENSKIEWTDQTFNPWWGCSKVSPGCENCYALTFAKRYNVGWGPAAPRRFNSEKYWEAPLQWDARAKKTGRRTRVFCSSMADVFEHNFEQNDELSEARGQLWRLIRRTPNLDWLILTKRPELVDSMIPAEWRDKALGTAGWPVNVWLGVSVENQAMANQRIPVLLETGAQTKFLSCEPLLGPLNLERFLYTTNHRHQILHEAAGRKNQ